MHDDDYVFLLGEAFFSAYFLAVLFLAAVFLGVVFLMAVFFLAGLVFAAFLGGMPLKPIFGRDDFLA